MKKFGETAGRLSKNPLGILALLIVLVYAIAGLVASSDNFSGNDLTILVWFLVLFPLVVLSSLVFLVCNHHDKLYAPSDFTDESHFVSLVDQSLSQSENFNRLNNSTKSIEQELEAISDKDTDQDEVIEELNFVKTELPHLSKNKISVLEALRDGVNLYRSISGIATDCQLSKTQVRDLLFTLEEEGLISSRDRGRGMKYFIVNEGRSALALSSKPLNANV